MAGGEDETVTIGPMGIGRVEPEVFGPQHESEIGATHGEAAVAALGFLDSIDGQRFDRLGDEGFNRFGGEVGGFLAHRFGELSAGHSICLAEASDEQVNGRPVFSAERGRLRLERKLNRFGQA